ncbi:MAG: 50S ribosomal protein L15 [Paludibacteraceae bacterium]|jgi:large subunit ribosomal protein L15|nr:50S ribosomal protein L15 [Paludibacteraceae bacterium]MBR6104419.1 50S ribosomal protein L15 [Paludibacteraceae bacterium]
MDLSNLQPAKGSSHRKRRLGRGQGSGYGGTSTRGNKGAASRSGYSHKIGFEGGQMPLQRRLPKFGFKNVNRVSYKAVNIGDLQELADKNNVADINKNVLLEAGLIGKNDLVKVLGNGSVTKALNVTADAFSESAKSAIEAAGGKVETLKK